MATGPTYQIGFSRPAAKELGSLPTDIQRRMAPRIADLAGNPRPGDSKKLTGEVSGYRIRIGDYRVLYSVIDDESLVIITAVRHRKDAYRP